MAFGDPLRIKDLGKKRGNAVQVHAEEWVVNSDVKTSKVATKPLMMGKIQGAVRAQVVTDTPVTLASGAVISLTVKGAFNEEDTYKDLFTKVVFTATEETTFESLSVIGSSEIPVEAGPWIKVDYTIATPGASTGNISVSADYISR